MADEEPQEYSCPECGASFEDGAEKCPDCGLVFDWSEETDYICPDCGSTVNGDAGECSECGAQFVHDHSAPHPPQEERTIDAMLDAAVAETLVTPIMDASEQVPEEDAGEGAGDAAEEGSGDSPGEGEPQETGSPEVPGGEGIEASEEHEGYEEHEEHEGYEEVPVTSTEATSTAPKVKQGVKTSVRRYAGGFTLVGIMFVVLSGVALVLTIVALRWDAISSGSRYESIGSRQSMVIMMGIAGFIVAALVSVWDLLRGARVTEQ